MKGKILRLLILEDNPDDAELAIKELEHNGFKMDWTRVESEKYFKKEILSGEYDLILADYSLPSCNGSDALRIQQEQTPEIPLIIISGTIGEEVAIECLKSGATDYVLKDRISRLPSVVKRALRETELLKEQKLAEEREKVHRGNIEFLSITAMRFVEMAYEEDIYHFIAEQLSNLTGKSIIAVNSIDRKTGLWTTRTVTGLREFKEKTVKILGRNPEGMTYEGGDESLKILLSDGSLHEYGKNFYDLLCEKVPKRNCLSFEKLFNISKILVMGFAQESRLFGSAAVLIPENVEIENREVIEAFAKQASIALQRRQLEKALRESEGWLRTMFEASEDCIFIKDHSRRYTHVNPSIERIFGKSAQEIIGCTDQELFNEDADKYVSMLDLKVFDGETVEVEHTLPVNGKPTTFHTIKVPIRNDSEEITGLLGFARNISERKHREEKLRFLSSAVEQSFDGMAITDLEGNLLFVNKSWAKMHDYDPKTELIGRHLSIFHNKKQLVDEAIPFNEKVIRNGFNTGEVNHIRSNGTSFPTMMTSTLMVDENGSSVAIIGTARDITREKRDEKALRESEAQKQALLDGSPNMIILVDTDLRVLWANRTALNMSPDSVGQFCYKAFPELNEPCKGCPIVKAAETGKMETGIMHQDAVEGVKGESYWEDIGVPLKDEKGNVTSVIKIARNITDRVLSEQELIRKNKELERFNTLAVGRELKMVELKREINRLLEELGKEPEFKPDDSGIEENR